MVTYCTGNVLLKRKHFRRENTYSILSLDNDEVITTFAKGNKMYYITGSTPFGNMTVIEYINYQRSLINEEKVSFVVVKKVLAKLGVRIKATTKMDRLKEIGYRVVCFIARVCMTTEIIYINFDNVAYSKSNHRLIRKMLNFLSKTYMVYVAISDTRFIKKKSPVYNFTELGVKLKYKKHRACRVGKNIIKKNIPSLVSVKTLPRIDCIVKCS